MGHDSPAEPWRLSLPQDASDAEETDSTDLDGDGSGLFGTKRARTELSTVGREYTPARLAAVLCISFEGALFSRVERGPRGRLAPMAPASPAPSLSFSPTCMASTEEARCFAAEADCITVVARP